MDKARDFSFNIEQLCSFCYKENRHFIFKEDKCSNCQNRNINPVYVNSNNYEEFVRDFRNSGSPPLGCNILLCNCEGIIHKYKHATINRGCSFASSLFEYFVWNWMKTHKKYKISDIFSEFIAPFVLIQKVICVRPSAPMEIHLKERQEKIYPVPQSSDENKRVQEEEKKKIYFCWFCFRNITSEHEILKHVNGNDHKLFYENDKKRRWYFKMPRSKPVSICKEINCSCLSPHLDDEYREMNARIKFRNFDFKYFDFEKKKLNPWPRNIDIKMPLFPHNLDSYNGPLRINVSLTLNGWTVNYICLRDDDSRPFFCLYDNNSNQKGQILKFESYNTENFDFDIEFSPLCSGTYVQRVEFVFMLNGNEYSCQRLLRADVGSSEHLKQFKNIWDRFHVTLKRDLQYDNIVPFSLYNPTGNSILDEKMLRRVFKVVSNINWLNIRVEPWNHCDWMRDMMVHEELEQQLILSQLIYVGDIIVANHFKKESFIPAKPGHLFGTIIFKNDPQSSVARDFVVKYVIKAFVLYKGLNNKPSLHECDIVDLYHYDVESRSIKGVTICFPNVAVKNLNLENGTNLKNATVIFRYNRMVFERRHTALDKMPHYDSLTYAPLCCPYFTHLPYGEAESAVVFKPHMPLNEEQLRLPKLVLRKLQNNEIVLPFILNGAFGTGKSSVIAETVRTILILINSRARILICTRSYSAGKVYLNMFQNCLPEKFMNKIKLIIPLRREIDYNYIKFTIDNDSLTQEMFQNNRVFITSLDNVSYSMSGFVGYYNEDNTMFDYIFVDEAAQVLEVDAIMVYQFGNKKSKFIFAGDVFQVRPDYYNKNLKKFSLPIVCRLHNMYQRCYDYEICLKQVYRSHPLLVDYLSKAIYYNCDLVSHMTPLYPNLKPMKFIDSNKNGNNREEFDDVYCSFRNDLEAKMIIIAVHTLLSAFDIPQSNILICSPFYSQVKMIRDKLNKKGLKSIKVMQPSGIQGQEYDAVFISTVLTVNNELKYPIYHSTFHSDKTVINLAISRARSYVEVVGDKTSLLQRKCKDQWAKFIEFCG